VTTSLLSDHFFGRIGHQGHILWYVIFNTWKHGKKRKKKKEEEMFPPMDGPV
jgi:hypothetical protein